MADLPSESNGTGRPVLVTDFDGTLYRGDAPLRFYAERAAAALPTGARRELLESLDRYLSLGVAAAATAVHPDEAAALTAAVDGWEAVAGLGRRRHGLPRTALDDAFLATRAYMATPDCALEVPPEYARLLTELRADGVRVILATNSPVVGLDALLGRLGVRPLLGEVVSSTGKPAGLSRLLRAELGLPAAAPAGAGVPDPGQSCGGPSGAGRSGTGPGRSGAHPGPVGAAAVFAVGDHWANDIAPAVELGVGGGYIDRYGRSDGPATATAAEVEGLLPTLRAWAAEAHRLTTSHPSSKRS